MSEPDKSTEAPATPPPAEHRRRAGVRGLMSAVVLSAALAGLTGPAAENPGPPDLTFESARYRADGGQALGPGRDLAVNALTRLNLGWKIDPAEAAPRHLAALPGLGPASAAKLREEGRLTARQRKYVNGLVMEKCDPNNP